MEKKIEKAVYSAPDLTMGEIRTLCLLCQSEETLLGRDDLVNEEWYEL